MKKKIKINKLLFFLKFIIIISFYSNIEAKNTYFDLSEKNIKIKTDFVGKEIIIFGILNDQEETIITIKGPIKNSRILKKERLFGLWFNTKQITYNKVPSIFFIASSSNVQDILPTSTIIKEGLSFNYILENKTSKRNFIANSSEKIWKNNFVRIQKSKNLFKDYEIKNVDNKLFQTSFFFPADSIPGEYRVNIYQVKSDLIVGKEQKIITLEKSGIGSKVYYFAHNNSLAYGLFTVIFAIISGLIAATLFRRS